MRIPNPSAYWRASSTLGQVVAVVAIGVLLWFGGSRLWERFTDWRGARRVSELQTQIDAAKAEAEKYKAAAAENARQIEQKEAQLVEANARADQLAEALTNATRNRVKTQGAYERIRDSPIDRQSAPPTLTALCAQLAALGKPCNE